MFISVESLHMFSTFAKSAMTLGTAAGCLLMAASSAHAFSFTTNFTPTVRDAEDDILLQSVEVDGNIIDFSDLAVVSGANILFNDQITDDPSNNPQNQGAASADVVDNSASGVAMEQLTPGDANSEAAIVSNLSSQNLGHIIDTEDSGIFEIELNFDKAFSSLLFWERGLNSDLGVRIGGKEIILTSDMFEYAGYDLDTTEIEEIQDVGSYGLDLAAHGLSGKYTSAVIFTRDGFNGPDWKVAGVAVPEPATVLGLTAVAGAVAASRRRRDDRTA